MPLQRSTPKFTASDVGRAYFDRAPGAQTSLGIGFVLQDGEEEDEKDVFQFSADGVLTPVERRAMLVAAWQSLPAARRTAVIDAAWDAFKAAHKLDEVP